MHLRLAQQQDYQPLLALLQQLNPDDPPADDRTYQVFQDILSAPSLLLIVAEQDNILLGSCYLNIIANLTRNARPYGLIENVVTAGQCRRQGVGRRLLEYAGELAREAGCYKLMLMSGRSDPGVHAFYQHCGFSPDSKQAYIRRF